MARERWLLDQTPNERCGVSRASDGQQFQFSVSWFALEKLRGWMSCGNVIDVGVRDRNYVNPKLICPFALYFGRQILDLDPGR